MAGAAMYNADTIAAIATAPGQGGIGIVRISGPDALPLLRRIFRPSHAGSRHPDEVRLHPRHMYHGWIHALPCAGESAAYGESLDEVLAVYMPGPRTATGEDTAELHCHGGPAVLRVILDTVLAAGARMAERGEFTYRAFVNGRMDLAQAEAVAELIAAPSRQGLRLAKAKLEGLLSRRISGLRTTVDGLRAGICLALDFPEDEGECLDYAAFSASLKTMREGITELLAGFERTRCWREGAGVVLIGRVNVGKSSLLNALLGRERAIVSSQPGTTRDFIEESLDLDGLRVRLTDTAGLRESSDPVERAGVRRTRDLAMETDCVLLVLEAGVPLERDELELMATLDSRLLVVWNKVDRLDALQRARAVTLGNAFTAPQVFVSAQSGEGLDILAQTLRHWIVSSQSGTAVEPDAGDLAPNLRQSQLLRAALQQVAALERDLAAALPGDILSVGLDVLSSLLGEITGESTPDDILGQIFSHFCIGK